MKRILLSAVVLLSMSLSAQVGINTTSPEAELDVNGNVKVRTLNNNDTADRLVVVGADNILSTNPIAGFSPGGFGSTAGNSSVSIGKTYTCNSKNLGVRIYLTMGTAVCSNSGGYKWGGRAQDSGHTPGAGYVWYELSCPPKHLTDVVGYASSMEQTSKEFVSGDVCNLNAGGTLLMHVINDSEYKN